MRAAGDADLPEEEERPRFGIEHAKQHDAYWRATWASEAYARADCDYEDYAPAYCVGYVGHAQYGGAWRDAVPSLRANWERIKGGSRLTADEALLAAQAAWLRAEHLACAERLTPAERIPHAEKVAHADRATHADHPAQAPMPHPAL